MRQIDLYDSSVTFTLTTVYDKSNFNGDPRDVMVPPKSMWFPVLESVHDHYWSHSLGYAKCLEIMSACFYFRGMAKFIRKYLPSCTVDLNNAADASYEASETYLTVDTVGPITSSNGYRYILIRTWKPSSFVITQAVRNRMALAVAEPLCTAWSRNMALPFSCEVIVEQISCIKC